MSCLDVIECSWVFDWSRFFTSRIKKLMKWAWKRWINCSFFSVISVALCWSYFTFALLTFCLSFIHFLSLLISFFLPRFVFVSSEKKSIQKIEKLWDFYYHIEKSLNLLSSSHCALVLTGFSLFHSFTIYSRKHRLVDWIGFNIESFKNVFGWFFKQLGLFFIFIYQN